MSVRHASNITAHQSQFPKEKVSYGRHLFARIFPGFGGEPDLMESEKPLWLTKLQTRFSEKTNAITHTFHRSPKEHPPKKTTQTLKTEPIAEVGESFWEKINRLMGR